MVCGWSEEEEEESGRYGHVLQDFGLELEPFPVDFDKIPNGIVMNTRWIMIIIQ